MNESPTCLSCMGSGVVAGEPCQLCLVAGKPDASFAQAAAATTTEQQLAELHLLEREALDALCAITGALQLGLLSFVGLSQIQGKALVELSVIQGGKPRIMPFPGATVADAFISAGKEVHSQLMLVHGVKELPWYVSAVGTRAKLRQQPKIITSVN